jgi:type VI secretion system secreted protein Hcp
MKKMLGSAVLALALIPASAALANDRDDGHGSGLAVFVKIDGVDGASTQKGHEGEIEAFTFSETLRQSASAGTATGAGKVTPGPFVFTKVVDKSSVSLFRLCATGEHIKQVSLTVRKAGGQGKSGDFYKITLKDVLVSAINEKFTGDSLVDEVQLIYDGARWEVFDPPDATEWDGKTNKVNSTAPTTGRNSR